MNTKYLNYTDSSINEELKKKAFNFGLMLSVDSFMNLFIKKKTKENPIVNIGLFSIGLATMTIFYEGGKL